MSQGILNGNNTNLQIHPDTVNHVKANLKQGRQKHTLKKPQYNFLIWMYMYVYPSKSLYWIYPKYIKIKDYQLFVP